MQAHSKRHAWKAILVVAAVLLIYAYTFDVLPAQKVDWVQEVVVPSDSTPMTPNVPLQDGENLDVVHGGEEAVEEPEQEEPANEDTFSPELASEDLPEGSYAYATFLCDDEMLESAQVLVRSLVKSGTKKDIIVMVLPAVSPTARRNLEILGAKVVDIDEIEYPFDAAKANKGFNKSCRYSKLNLWGLTDYTKAVYLDADTMILDNVDELFSYPQFSAIVDIGSTMNTGVFVFKPSKATLDHMIDVHMDAPSYNRGDQGFLNWYFNFSSVTPLPGVYNVMSKYKNFGAGRKLIQDAKILHFTSETKPWSFHNFYHASWEQNYDASMFYKYRIVEDEVHHILAEANDEPSTSKEGEIVPLTGICAAYDTRFEGIFPGKTRYGVLINVKDSKHLDPVRAAMKRYGASKQVSAIYINFEDYHQPDSAARGWSKSRMTTFKKTTKKPVRLLQQEYHEEYQTFDPINGLRESALYVVDDYIDIASQDVDFAHEVWRSRPLSLVGHFPYLHTLSEDAEQAGYRPSTKGVGRYTILEGRSLFVRSDYLFAFTCLLPKDLQSWLQNDPHCRDIAMNLLAVGMSHSKPIHVGATITTPTGAQTQSETERRQAKAECLAYLSKQWWEGKDHLIMNTETVLPYTG